MNVVQFPRTLAQDIESMECLPCLVTAFIVCVGFWTGIGYLIWSMFHG